VLHKNVRNGQRSCLSQRIIILYLRDLCVFCGKPDLGLIAVAPDNLKAAAHILVFE
jgi:hypothetical protein